MSDIVEFLKARFAEDEQRARAAIGSSQDDGVWEVEHHGCPNDPRDGERWRDYCECCVIDGDGIRIYDEGGHDWDQAKHIAAWDPARVLREVAAKRQILAKYEAAVGALDNTEAPSADWYYVAIGDAIAALLTVYSGHPDYWAGWKP